jgi:hypothetical protein
MSLFTSRSNVYGSYGSDAKSCYQIHREAKQEQIIDVTVEELKGARRGSHDIYIDVYSRSQRDLYKRSIKDAVDIREPLFNNSVVGPDVLYIVLNRLADHYHKTSEFAAAGYATLTIKEYSSLIDPVYLLQYFLTENAWSLMDERILLFVLTLLKEADYSKYVKRRTGSQELNSLIFRNIDPRASTETITKALNLVVSLDVVPAALRSDFILDVLLMQNTSEALIKDLLSKEIPQSIREIFLNDARFDRLYRYLSAVITTSYKDRKRENIKTLSGSNLSTYSIAWLTRDAKVDSYVRISGLRNKRSNYEVLQMMLKDDQMRSFMCFLKEMEVESATYHAEEQEKQRRDQKAQADKEATERASGEAKEASADYQAAKIRIDNKTSGVSWKRTMARDFSIPEEWVTPESRSEYE